MKRDAMNVQEKVAEADRSLASSKVLYARAIEDKVSQEKVDAAKAEIDVFKVKITLLINEYADFRKINCEYNKFDDDGMSVGDKITETVKMDIPCPAFTTKDVGGRVFMKMIIGRVIGL